MQGKIVLIISICLTLLLCGCGSVGFDADTGIESAAKISSAEQEISVEPAQSWLDSYENLMLHFPQEEIWLPREYPDEYGGCFTDNVKLYIQLTDISTQMQEKYIAWCGGKEYLEFREVKYSVNELQEYEAVQLAVRDYGIDVLWGAVDEKHNCYVICINADGYDRERVKEAFQYVLKEDYEKAPIEIAVENKGASIG